MQKIETVIIGGGQAGLATSYCLGQFGRENIVLEKSDIPGSVWRDDRWDSFTLNTPNSMLRMPGAVYDGPDPDGFLSRTELLRSRGYNVLTAEDAGLRGRDDRELVAKAFQDDRILLTQDLDFLDDRLQVLPRGRELLFEPLDPPSVLHRPRGLLWRPGGAFRLATLRLVEHDEKMQRRQTGERNDFEVYLGPAAVRFHAQSALADRLLGLARRLHRRAQAVEESLTRELQQVQARVAGCRLEVRPRPAAELPSHQDVIAENVTGARIAKDAVPTWLPVGPRTWTSTGTSPASK